MKEICKNIAKEARRIVDEEYEIKKALDVLKTAPDQSDKNICESYAYYYYLSYVSGVSNFHSLIKAIDYYKKALGGEHDAEVLNQLGECYIISFGKLRDEKSAFECYLKSAELNYPQSQFIVGMYYLKGLGTAKNFTAAKKWLSAAKANGSEEAAEKLAEYFPE